jgi:hypothetical protein
MQTEESVIIISEVQPMSIPIEQAQDLAEGSLLQPSFLPSSTFKLTTVRQLSAPTPDNVSGAKFVFKYRNEENHWIALTQEILPSVTTDQLQPLIRMTLHVPFHLGTIHDQPAIFYTIDVTAQEQPGGKLTIRHCMWEHQDTLMELQAPWLSFEELVKIGESLQ